MRVWVRMSAGYDSEPMGVYYSRLRGLKDAVREIRKEWDEIYSKRPPKRVYYVLEYPSRRERPETWKEFRNRCASSWMVEVELYG